jgi:hypothetical protein
LSRIFGSEDAQSTDVVEGKIVCELHAQSLWQIRHFGERVYPLLVKPIGDLIGTIRWLGDPAQLVEMQRFDVGYSSDVHGEI